MATDLTITCACSFIEIPPLRAATHVMVVVVILADSRSRVTVTRKYTMSTPLTDGPTLSADNDGRVSRPQVKR